MKSKNAERLQQAGRSGAAEPSGPMPPLYTVTEVADYLHVSRSTVYRLIEDGSLRGTRIGQALRFTPDNIRELIALGSVDRAPNAWAQGSALCVWPTCPFAAYRP